MIEHRNYVIPIKKDEMGHVLPLNKKEGERFFEQVCTLLGMKPWQKDK